MTIAPKRMQRRRTAGWTMPPDAIYVGRPSPWGNPFPWDDERATWMAVAFGHDARELGRRTAAVALHRWWLEGATADTFHKLLLAKPTRLEGQGGELEYSDGSVRTMDQVVGGLALTMFLREPLVLPKQPDLTPLTGHDLVCWCPVDPPTPCHADTLLELAGG